MLKTIFIIFVVLVVAILIFASTKPDIFQVQRSITINAPADRIFNIINNHHNWSAWSPWEKLDPSMKKTFSGADSGVGAIFEWDGNKKAGAGRSEIMESIPPSKIIFKLDMIRPFEGHNTVGFVLETQQDATTKVTWSMHGQQAYFAKLMSVFIDCGKMVGRDFDEGLANLKILAEKPA
jgi:hypothetical protein